MHLKAFEKLWLFFFLTCHRKLKTRQGTQRPNNVQNTVFNPERDQTWRRRQREKDERKGKVQKQVQYKSGRNNEQGNLGEAGKCKHMPGMITSCIQHT